MAEEVVIVSAVRTPIGSFCGSLMDTPTYKLSSALIRHIIFNTSTDVNDISEVIMGHVLPAGQGQNPTRRSAMDAGIPKEIPSWTLNQVCGSGLKSIAIGCSSILANVAMYGCSNHIIIAGGHENMSCTPHLANIRHGVHLGEAKLIDSMINDGLWDIFNNVHMGITAENIARQFNISRQDQDEFALASQQKAAIARNSGAFTEEIVPITVQKKKESVVFFEDEYIKADTTIGSLQKLRPAFIPDRGTVTAGNASGINDGASIVMLMSASEAKKRKLPPLATIKSFAQCGVDPSIMGTGPVPASRKALELAGWTIDDLDLIEANEAFAAQAIYVNKEMNWDINKVNINGGAIALGHPIGASGARILTTLIHALKKRGGGRGLATLCVGGGMGVAMCIQV